MMTADEWTAFITTKRAEYNKSAFAADDALDKSFDRFLGEAIAELIREERSR